MIVADLAVLLAEELRAARKEMQDEASRIDSYRIHSAHRHSAQNMLDYLVFRRRDHRRIQAQLRTLGLSSLGRSESSIGQSIDNVIALLDVLCGAASSAAMPVLAGEGAATPLVEARADDLLGPPHDGLATRIMVTLPSEAANDYPLVERIARAGMDCARVNCAHDDADAWRSMVANVQRAARAVGRPIHVQMDLAGPKLRTGPGVVMDGVIKLRPSRDKHGRATKPGRARVPFAAHPKRSVEAGTTVSLRDARGSKRHLTVESVGDGWLQLSATDTAYLTGGLRLRQGGRKVGRVAHLPPLELPLLLHVGDTLFLSGDAGATAVGPPPTVGCTAPELVAALRAGHDVWFDDGTIGAVVEEAGHDIARLRVTHAGLGGSKLRAEKGVNAPDADLHLPALTAKDRADLAAAAELADLVAMSFVQTPQDIADLQGELERLGANDIGIVLKIETRQAFAALPQLILAAMTSPRIGVMIARGDLAIECGWERLAEVQEEILWLCEAAHVPVIWATQVLESLAKSGLPSRAEVTDAAMGERAECVMLNKGPHIDAAITTLADILGRMDDHQDKKSSLLRQLQTWELPAVPATPATPP